MGDLGSTFYRTVQPTYIVYHLISSWRLLGRPLHSENVYIGLHVPLRRWAGSQCLKSCRASLLHVQAKTSVVHFSVTWSLICLACVWEAGSSSVYVDDGDERVLTQIKYVFWRRVCACVGYFEDFLLYVTIVPLATGLQETLGNHVEEPSWRLSVCYLIVTPGLHGGSSVNCFIKV